MATTDYTNEIKHYREIAHNKNYKTYAGKHFAGRKVYAARSIVRPRTRFTNESRFKNEKNIM